MMVGNTLGTVLRMEEGEKDGALLGRVVGEALGAMDGLDGTTDGVLLGGILGDELGAILGLDEGITVGSVGADVGMAVGFVGFTVGFGYL